nr:uncharacterized protein [uncultured bacterium]
MFLLRAEQAAQVPALVGKTFTVGEVSSAGDGISKWLVLQPTSDGGATAAKATILKVEGGRQLPALVGKTVTVGKSPVIGTATNNWLALYPTKGAGAASLAKGTIMLPIGHTNGQMAALTGKTFTIGQAPAGVNPYNWLVLHPGGGGAAKGAASGISGGLLTGGVAGGKSMLAKGAIVGAGTTAIAGAGVATKGASAGGAILAGSALGGLGPVFPVLLAVAAVAGGYYLYKRRKNDQALEGGLDDAASFESPSRA